MKRSAKIVLSLGSISAALWLVYALVDKQQIHIASRAAEAKTELVAAVAPRNRSSFSPKSAQSQSNKRTFNSLETGYRWNPLDPGIAENEKDAAWLSAHGYPGPDVEKYLMSLSIDALRALAEKGNQPAQAILAYRLALSGASADEFMGILDRSAAAGSVYATKMTADILQTVPEFRNPELARAYYGVLLRRGDQGGIIANTVFGSQLSQEQLVRSRMLEEVLWRKLMSARMRIYGRPFDPSMRPGFISLMERVQNPPNKG